MIIEITSIVTAIASVVVASASAFALISWRSDKLFDQAVSTVSLLFSVKDAFKRITEPKWNYGTPIEELTTKYEQSHKRFLEFRKEYNKFKAVYGSLCEDDFSALWTEEDKILKTIMFYQNTKAFRSQKIVLNPDDYWGDAGLELMRNVEVAVKNIEDQTRPYIIRPLLHKTLSPFYVIKRYLMQKNE